MPKLILTRGIPGSGKSTWATQYQKDNSNCIRVNRDSLRWMTYGAPYTDQKGLERLVRDMEKKCVETALEKEYDVVLDNTHCNVTAIQDWIFYAGVTNVMRIPAKKIKVIVLDFPVSVAEAIRRDKLREHPVGATVIRQMAGLLKKQKADELYETDIKPLVQIGKDFK